MMSNLCDFTTYWIQITALRTRHTVENHFRIGHDIYIFIYIYATFSMKIVFQQYALRAKQ